MRQRVIVSLTTIPSRLNSIQPTLLSIHNQTWKPDDVYLTIPEVCGRTKEKYPKISAEIRSLCRPVYIEKDYGPLTKIVGGLFKESLPETIIITIDDDVIYPETLIEELVESCQRFPDSAIGSSGLSIGKFPFIYSLRFNQEEMNRFFMMKRVTDGQNIDFLYGYAGVLYKRGFFPQSVEEIKEDFLNKVFDDKDLFRNDDILISSYLNKRGIPRRLIKASSVHNNSGEDALSGNMLKFILSLDRSIRKCKKMGWIRERAEVSTNETCGSLVLLLIIVLFICVLYYIY